MQGGGPQNVDLIDASFCLAVGVGHGKKLTIDDAAYSRGGGTMPDAAQDAALCINWTRPSLRE